MSSLGKDFVAEEKDEHVIRTTIRFTGRTSGHVLGAKFLVSIKLKRFLMTNYEYRQVTMIRVEDEESYVPRSNVNEFEEG